VPPQQPLLQALRPLTTMEAETDAGGGLEDMFTNCEYMLQTDGGV